MKLRHFVASLILTFFTMTLFSQSCDCGKILDMGVYNEVRKSTKSNDFRQEIRSSCDKLDEAIKKSEGGGANVSFDGFGIGGNYSKEELYSIKHTYCESQSIQISNDHDYKYYSKIIEPEVYNAYNKCITLCATKNIQLQITPTDIDFETVKISLTGSFPNPRLAPSLQPMYIDTAVFKILDGDLFDASFARDTLNRNYNLLLERKILKVEDAKPIVDSRGKRLVISKETIISINLNDHNSLDIIVPEIPYYNEPVYISSPLLGQIIASVFDSASFFNIPNINKDEWMLANGQEVPKSATFFKKIYGEKVPDLRGVFIRGKNYSRNDEYSNPEGDRPNGFTQMDSLKRHYHDFYGSMLGIGILMSPVDRQRTYIDLRDQTNLNSTLVNSTRSTEGSETRPKNITLSYYIRINVRDIGKQ